MKTEEFSYLKPKEVTGNLCDFALFLAVMKHKEAYESLLSIILDEPDFRLEEVKVEEVVLNQNGMRAIRLDAWGRDIWKRHFNTEMQNDSSHNEERRRARFYQSLMDSPLLKAGKETRYKNLPDTVILFITEKDIFGRNRAMYTFTEQSNEEPELQLGDGTTKIFLNMSSQNGRPELVSLLQYLKDSRLDNPKIKVLDARIIKLDTIFKEVKESEEWEELKMTIMEYAMNKGIELGIERGISAIVRDNVEECKSMEQIIEKLMRLFELSQGEAEAYYMKFK